MNRKQKKTLYRILGSLAMLAVIIPLCHFFAFPAPLEFILYVPPYLLVGGDILRKAGKGIKNRQVFDENFLMAVATLGAIGLGEYTEGVAVMLFYQIGELFQSVAVGRSRKSITALMDIRPDYANVIRDGQIEKTDPEEVAVGTVIVVNPGEKIPIDGVVVEGSAALNTGALTGESLPRDVSIGDEVISGCISMNGRLMIKTTKKFGDSTVSLILDLVENSAMKKSRSENFITKFARYYTPAVCFGALALAVLPPVIRLFLSADPNWGTWIFRALTFLVISCPCALVISIPLSFFGGIGCASSNGILVKGSNYLEALSKAGYMVFDKTGTLTKGEFEVAQIFTAEGVTKEELLEAAAYAESSSSHPISVSLRSAYGKLIDQARLGAIEEKAGRGVSAEVDGRTVLAGNLRLMEESGVRVSAEHNEGTVCYVAADGCYLGCILIADAVKPTAVRALAELKRRGIRKNVMLTGDGEQTAAMVARELGIDEFHSGLFPNDKVALVEQLLEQKNEKETLAFVGDGINDAPVLSRADIGIAMGAMGSDAAMEAADIVLMDDDPAKIALAMRIAAKTLSIVRENIVFALGVKACCLILGALGYADMWLAIFADVGVMVLAVANAARALTIRA